MTKYLECSDFQKTVLGLIGELSTSKREIEKLQKEFLKLDTDKSGTLSRDELNIIYKASGGGEQDWDTVFKQIDLNGDGVISFDEYITAFIEKKVLTEHK